MKKNNNTKFWVVYLHTNLINHKKYVGITCTKKPEYRWGSKGQGYKQQAKFYNAIKKYGWENFSHEILASGLTEEEALDLETYYIEKYNSIDNGYNILLHEIQSYHREKPVYCITTKKLYSSIKEAALDTKTQPSRIIQNCKGQIGPIGGLNWGYWDSEKSTYHHKDFHPKINYKPAPIYCVELNKIYPTIVSAQREFNLDERALYKALNGKRNGCGGCHFIRMNELSDEKVREVMTKPTGKNRYVFCLETKEIFYTVKEAGLKFQVENEVIQRCCRGEKKDINGKHLIYLTEYYKNIANPLLRGENYYNNIAKNFFAQGDYEDEE